MSSAALSLAVTVFVLIAVPGPSNLYIVGQTLASGRRAAFLSIIGNTLGFAAIGAAVVLVLGELLQRTDWLQTALVLVGVAVLAILAAMYLREARCEWSGIEPDQETVTVSTSSRRAFSSGLVIGVTNPKGPILFGTIVPGFLPADAATYPALIWLALIPLAIGPIVDSFWVVCASAARGWIMRAGSHQGCGRGDAVAHGWLHASGRGVTSLFRRLAVCDLYRRNYDIPGVLQTAAP